MNSAALPDPASSTPDPRLIVVSPDPFNAEAPLLEQPGVITPNSLFYVRSHFAVPRIDLADWHLSVAGEVQQSLQLTFDQLHALPTKSLLVTLECAGNGRSGLQPKADGEPWQYGAVSTAEWTGVPVRAVLEAAGLTERAREVLVQGADGGHVAAIDRAIPYQRSLSLDMALDPDTVLAYAMNGEPLPAAHGFPLRLVVPGWYGMAAVKWVTRLEVLAEPFQGFYQVDRYVMAHPERGETMRTPLTAIRVRSVIISPPPRATLSRGEQFVRGLAWSGAAPVVRVEVSVDDGRAWERAELVSQPQRYAWCRWEYRWHVASPGPATLLSRAYDAAGNSQPAEPEWNKLGYANNAIQRIPITVA